jgi:hypothetical protein
VAKRCYWYSRYLGNLHRYAAGTVDGELLSKLSRLNHCLQAWIKTQFGKYRPARCEDRLIDATVWREAAIEWTVAGVGAIRHGERC